MADIFEEVDEELKQDNAKKLWDQYGKYVVAVAVLVVASVAGYQGWRGYVADRQQSYSTQFLSAQRLAAENKNSEAAAVFATLSNETSGGYALLSRFREAQSRTAAGEAKAAIDIYEAIASDGSVEQLYRDLAVLLSVLSQIDSGDPASLSARLQPLLGAENVWRFTAAEANALLALRMGDKAAAKTAFEALADDLNAPQGLRRRATQLLSTF